MMHFSLQRALHLFSLLWLTCTVDAAAEDRSHSNSTHTSKSAASPTRPRSYSASTTQSSPTHKNEAYKVTRLDPNPGCARATPSPTYWFAERVFHYAYKKEPCRYDYCRAQFNESFPSPDSVNRLSSVKKGIFITSKLVPVTVTKKGKKTVTTTTTRYKQYEEKTITGLQAWWGNARDKDEHCCDVCHIIAGTIDLRYWPPATRGQPRVSTIVVDGYTFVSPSIYMAFDTIMAQDGCKTIGSDHSNQTYAFNPADISSVYAVVTTVDQTETTMWSSRLVDWDKFYALDCKSAQGRDYDPYDPIHFDPMNYDPCNPRIAIPPGFNTRIDPAWGACMTNRGFQGFYDPPFALDPTANLEVPDEAPYTTVAHDNITPSPPAAPQPVPDPGVKPTDYPKPSPADPKPAMPKGKNHPNPPTSTDGDDEASGDYDPTSDPKAKTKTQPQDPADIPPWTYPKDDSKSSPPKGEPQDDSSNYPPSSDPSNPSHSSNTPNPSNLSKTNPKYQPHNSDNNNDNNDDRKPYDPSKPDAPALSSIKGAFHPPSPTDSVQGPKSGEDAADPGYYIWSGIGGTPNRGGTQTNTVVGALPSVVNSPGGDSGSGDDRTNSGMGNGTTGGDGNTVIWSSGARRRGGDVWLSWIYRIIVGMVVLWV